MTGRGRGKKNKDAWKRNKTTKGWPQNNVLEVEQLRETEHSKNKQEKSVRASVDPGAVKQTSNAMQNDVADNEGNVKPDIETKDKLKDHATTEKRDCEDTTETNPITQGNVNATDSVITSGCSETPELPENLPEQAPVDEGLVKQTSNVMTNDVADNKANVRPNIKPKEKLRDHATTEKTDRESTTETKPISQGNVNAEGSVVTSGCNETPALPVKAPVRAPADEGLVKQTSNAMHIDVADNKSNSESDIKSKTRQEDHATTERTDRKDTTETILISERDVKAEGSVTSGCNEITELTEDVLVAQVAMKKLEVSEGSHGPSELESGVGSNGSTGEQQDLEENRTNEIAEADTIAENMSVESTKELNGQADHQEFQHEKPKSDVDHKLHADQRENSQLFYNLMDKFYTSFLNYLKLEQQQSYVTYLKLEQQQNTASVGDLKNQALEDSQGLWETTQHIATQHVEQQKNSESVLHKETQINEQEQAIVNNECNMTNDRALDVSKNPSCQAQDVAKTVGDENAHGENIKISKIPIQQDDEQKSSESVLHKETQTKEQAIVNSECNMTTDRALDVSKNPSGQAQDVAKTVGDENAHRENIKISKIPIQQDDEQKSSESVLHKETQTNEQEQAIVNNECNMTTDRALDVSKNPSGQAQDVAKTVGDENAHGENIKISKIPIQQDDEQKSSESVLHKETQTNEQVQAIVTNECNMITDRALDVSKNPSCQAQDVAKFVGDEKKSSNALGDYIKISEVPIQQKEEQKSSVSVLHKEVQTTEQAIEMPNEVVDDVIADTKNREEKEATSKLVFSKGVQTTEKVFVPNECNMTTDGVLDVGLDDDTIKPVVPIVNENIPLKNPLRFHKVHGETIRLSKAGFRAQRLKNSNLNSRGIAFSSRPVEIGEKVCLHLEQISSSWLGLVTFGFTKHDPDTLVGNLPANIISDRNSNDGYWAVNLEEIYCRESNKLHYLLNSSGNMCFGINGVDQGEFFWKLDTSKPMWAVVEIIGYFTAVEFDNPKILISKERLNSSTERTESADVINQSLEKNQENSCKNSRAICKLSPLKYQISFVPLDLFTQVKGLRVQYMEDRGVLVTTDIRGGHIFLKYPMFPGQIIVVQNLSGKKLPQIFCIGIKFCDPKTEASSKEHVSDPVATTVAMQFKDELAISFTKDGEIQVTKNFDVPNTLLKASRTKKLWPFVAIYRRNQRIRIWSNNTPSPTTIQS